jgi:hypothetical protein
MKPQHLSPYSPLLFTWTQNKPSYYVQNKDKLPASPSRAIISANLSQNEESKYLPVTTPFPVVTNFARQSGVFRYRTIVSVYN